MTIERYDVALSFADEDRDLASSLAYALRSRGILVFYDEFEKSKLWGKNLYDFLSAMYSSGAEFCVVFISEAYVRKVWTNLERQSAQSRALRERREFILPLRLDDSSVPGILDTMGSVDLRETSVEEVADLIKHKLDNLKDNLSEQSVLGGKDYFRSIGATIPEAPLHFKATSVIVFDFVTGVVVEMEKSPDNQEIWLYENGTERAVGVSDQLLQARRGHYVSVMIVAEGQALDGLVVAAMNYSTHKLVLAGGAIRFISAALVTGENKASKTLEDAGKISVLRILGVSLTALAIGSLLGIPGSIVTFLFWVAFVGALVYPFIIKSMIDANEKNLRVMIIGAFNPVKDN